MIYSFFGLIELDKTSWIKFPIADQSISQSTFGIYSYYQNVFNQSNSLSINLSLYINLSSLK